MRIRIIRCYDPTTSLERNVLKGEWRFEGWNGFEGIPVLFSISITDKTKIVILYIITIKKRKCDFYVLPFSRSEF